MASLEFGLPAPFAERPREKRRELGTGSPDSIYLENPRHTWNFADDVSDDEADRDHDNRRYAEFE